MMRSVVCSVGRTWIAFALLSIAVLTGCAKKEESFPSESPPMESGGSPEGSLDTTAYESPEPTTNGHPTMSEPPDVAVMPEFPWPPPEPTLRFRIPRNLLIQPGSETLGDVFDQITSALEHAGIDQWSAYSVGKKGIAVVSRLEHIKNDGTPATPRWSLASEPGRFNLGEYIRRLFFAKPGRYRVVAFIVRPPAPAIYTPAPTAAQLDTLLLNGVTDLPESLRSVPAKFSSVEALIYEFYRQSENQEPSFVRRQESPLTAVAHLAGAGIWTRQELTP